MFNFKASESGDFHIHTNFSDGILTPEEVVLCANANNIKHIAITDHDTMAGVRKAMIAGRDKGIRVVPGVEISSSFQDSEIHLLAYGLDPENSYITNWLKKIKLARWTRIGKMIAKLETLGMKISSKSFKNELIDDNSLPCRPHLARVLQKSGYVTTTKEAFDKYIGNNGPAYEEIETILSLGEIITLIKEHRGVIVIAHPYSTSINEKLPELIKLGIDGIEIHHPSTPSDKVSYLTDLCNKNNLIITGGSDTHDEKGVGSTRISYKEITKIKDLISKRGGLI